MTRSAHPAPGHAAAAFVVVAFHDPEGFQPAGGRKVFLIIKSATAESRSRTDDHGCTAVGACDAKPGTAPAAPARPQPARTRDITGSGGTNRANRAPGRRELITSRHDLRKRRRLPVLGVMPVACAGVRGGGLCWGSRRWPVLGVMPVACAGVRGGGLCWGHGWDRPGC
jgi:hypothetical protein